MPKANRTSPLNSSAQPRDNHLHLKATPIFVAAAMLLASFALLAHEVSEKEPLGFDRAIITALRAGPDYAVPLGPKWFNNAMLDLTAGPHLPASSAEHRPMGEDVPVLPSGGPITKPVYAGTALLADPALIENTPLGPMPRIADDGRKPMTAYAAPAAAGKFRIAIVMTGLGLSAKATQAAITGLPSAVTVGVLPYASDAPRWLSAARAAGHEVVLQVPMEPFDFPDSDPGPHTLRAGSVTNANAERLNWALTRFTGYAGVTNLLGLIEKEMRTAMALTGVKTIAEIDRKLLA